jgi:hypothetical protein
MEKEPSLGRFFSLVGKSVGFLGKNNDFLAGGVGELVVDFLSEAGEIEKNCEFMGIFGEIFGEKTVHVPVNFFLEIFVGDWGGVL